MKKWIVLVLVLSVLMSLAACGGSPKAEKQEPAETAEEAAPAEEAEEPAEETEAADGAESADGDNWWDDIVFDEQVNLTMACAGAPNSGAGLASEQGVAWMKERSGGKVNVEIVYNGALGNEQSCFAQAMEGSVDFTSCGVGTISQYTNVLDIIQLPFLVNTYELEAELFESQEWADLIEQANKDLETVTITHVTEFGMRQFATIKEPINTLEDLKGLKIRSIGNPIIDEALTMLGCNPVSITFTDLYSSLQNGIIDGEEINTASISMQKHYEVVNYVSEIGLYPFVTIGIMSNATRDSLPEGYADFIIGCLQESAAWYMDDMLYEWDNQSRQDCLDNGIEFNEIQDKEVWLETLQPLYDRVSEENPLYKAFIDKALELQK